MKQNIIHFNLQISFASGFKGYYTTGQSPAPAASNLRFEAAFRGKCEVRRGIKSYLWYAFVSSALHHVRASASAILAPSSIKITQVLNPHTIHSLQNAAASFFPLWFNPHIAHKCHQGKIDRHKKQR